MKANMADNDEENGLINITTLPNVTVTDSLSSDTVILADQIGESTIIHEDNSEDILRQAIQDAREYGEEAVTLSYVTAGEGGEQDPNNVTPEIVNNVITSQEESLATSVAGGEGTSYDISYAVVTDNGDMIQTDTMTLNDSIEAVMMAPESQNQNEEINLQQVQRNDDIITMQANDFANSVQQGPLNVTLVPANQNSVAPIGSSQNPIRIVQQGNQYTPVQQLTAEQLQQIMHVVQEQQLAKSADTNDESILYNPQTNTRIVYRVIYPSELHKSSADSSVQNTTITIGSQTGVDVDNSQCQRRVYKKRSREDEEDKVDGPEMSKEEKEERKKHRPRTRSGRVSKPPKHMVKDYKHIHVLDWDEDYDDSDGGYSDFKISDEDKEKSEARNNAENNNSMNKELDTGISPDFTEGGVGMERVKNYKCDGCDKAYIGQGGLRRHYQLNPSHTGSVPSEESEVEKVATVHVPESNVSSINNNNIRVNGSIGSLSEDSNTQDSLPSQSTPVITSQPYKPRGRGRGRPPQSVEGAPGRRRAKLQDLVRQCTDDELMEIVLPRLANVITLWEFLMMKVEKGGKALPKVDDIFHEFVTLQKHVSKTCQECLVPLTENKETSDSNGHKLQIEDTVMAACLGLKVGQYQVKTLPIAEKSFHYKLLTTEPLGIPAKRQNNRRTIEIVTPDELIQSCKKPRMTTLLTNSVVSMTAQASNSASVSVTAPSSTTSSPVTLLSTTSSSSTLLSTTSTLSTSVTPMQIIVNNHNIHNSLLSEPIQLPMPITSQVVDKPVSNNGILQSGNTQTVILTNSAPSTTFGTLNGGNVLNINGNNSVLINSSNGASLSNGSVVNNILVNDFQVQLESQIKANVPVSSMSNYIDPSEVNVEPLGMKSQIYDIRPNVQHGVSVIAFDPGETGDLQLQNGVQDRILDDTLQGEVIDVSELHSEQVLSADQIEGEIISPDQIVTSASNIYQTEDGILIIQNPDGTTFQLQGADGIPLETVQALLAMESDGQFIEQEQIQSEMQ